MIGVAPNKNQTVTDMQKYLILITSLIYGSAIASPFLISDPYPLGGAQPTKQQIFLDSGALIEAAPETLPNGAVRIRHDLAGISTGQHTVKTKFCNAWGCSGYSHELPFVAGAPDAPTGLGILFQ